MRKTNISWIVSAIIVIVAVGGCAPGSKESSTDFEPNPPAPDWIVVDQKIWLPIIDQLSRQVNAAYRHLEANRNQAAADELAGAADYLEQEAGDAGVREQAALRAAASELRGLAERVANGKVTRTAQMDKIVARAYDAHVAQAWSRVRWQDFVGLPEHYFGLAREALVAGQQEKAADRLRKAAAFMRLKTSRAVGRAESALLGSRRAVERLANKLEQGKEVSTHALDQVVSYATHALAYHHQQLGMQNLETRQFELARDELQAANFHVENGMVWAARAYEGGPGNDSLSSGQANSPRPQDHGPG